MSCEKQFLVGTTPRFPMNFYSGNTLVDPGDVQFIIERPDKSITVLVFGTDAEVVRSALGKFHVDLIIDAKGIWKWRWEGELTGISWANQGRFEAEKAEPVAA